MDMAISTESADILMKKEEFVKSFYNIQPVTYYCKSTEGMYTGPYHVITIDRFGTFTDNLVIYQTKDNLTNTHSGIIAIKNGSDVAITYNTSIAACMTVAKYIVEQEGFKMED